MSDLEHHDDIHDLLVRTPAPDMQFHLDDTVRLGKRVRLRRRIAAAGGGIAAIAAVAVAVSLSLPGPSAPTLSPAGAASSTPSPSVRSTALVDSQCFPMDPAVKSTPWFAATAANALPKGGPVTVTTEVLTGCPNNIIETVEGPEGQGDLAVTIKFAEKPSTAQWVSTNPAVLLVPKGQEPCGYSFVRDLGLGVKVIRGDWNVFVQPIPADMADSLPSAKLDLCKNDTVVSSVPALVGADPDAEVEFNHRLLQTSCDLHNLGAFEDSAARWTRKTVPNAVGTDDLTVEVRSHPGAGCTGHGSTTGPLDANDNSKGLLFEVDFPAAPTQAFWDVVKGSGDESVGAFVVPPGQAVCAIDLGAGPLSLPSARKVTLDNGWTLELHPLPATGSLDTMRADVCTAKEKILAIAPLGAR